jgi:hypothetical protein
MTNGTNKKTINHSISTTGILAPKWFIELKEAGASQVEIFEAVRSFCMSSMQDEIIDDGLVELTINSYES